MCHTPVVDQAFGPYHFGGHFGIRYLKSQGPSSEITICLLTGYAGTERMGGRYPATTHCISGDVHYPF
jgi:hypothetical protein